jgi:hypothetical protein
MKVVKFSIFVDVHHDCDKSLISDCWLRHFQGMLKSFHPDDDAFDRIPIDSMRWSVCKTMRLSRQYVECKRNIV